MALLWVIIIQAEFIYFGSLRIDTLHFSVNNHIKTSVLTYLLLCICSCS